MNNRAGQSNTQIYKKLSFLSIKDTDTEEELIEAFKVRDPHKRPKQKHPCGDVFFGLLPPFFVSVQLTLTRRCFGRVWGGTGLCIRTAGRAKRGLCGGSGIAAGCSTLGIRALVLVV